MKIEEAIASLQSRVEQLEEFQKQSVTLLTSLQKVLGVSLLDADGNLQASLMIPDKGEQVGFIPMILQMIGVANKRKVVAPSPKETQHILGDR